MDNKTYTRMWGMKKAIVISVVADALGAISTSFEKYDAAIEIGMELQNVQKPTLLETTRILRLVL